MNQLKHIVNEPHHRTLYPGEILLYTNAGTNPQKGTPPYVWGFQLLLQRFVSTGEAMKRMEHGACELGFKKGEPYIIAVFTSRGGCEARRPRGRLFHT